jgi:hypothetical protein
MGNRRKKKREEKCNLLIRGVLLYDSGVCKNNISILTRKAKCLSNLTFRKSDNPRECKINKNITQGSGYKKPDQKGQV